MRTLRNAEDVNFSLERVNISESSSTSQLVGVVHRPEGSTWGEAPVFDLRVEFSDPRSGVLYQRLHGARDWQSLCDFSFKGATAEVQLSATPTCTWSLVVGLNASARAWTLSAASPYILQHGAPLAQGPPTSWWKRNAHFILLPLLFLFQGAVKYLRTGYFGTKGAKKHLKPKDPAASAVKPEAAQRREAARAAAAAAGGTEASSSSSGGASNSSGEKDKKI